MNKFALQDELYSFPYHYLPHFEREGLPRITRTLSWGLEYLTYMTVVKEIVERLPGDTVLDIGCGDGYLLNSITKPMGKKLGVDVSERPIKFAQAFATDAEFEVLNIFDMTDRHDIVVLTEVLEHIPEDQIAGFVKQAKRLVVPGGHLVITVPTTVTPLNRKHYRHYDEALLSSQFGSNDGWSVAEERRLYRYSRRLKRVLRLLHNKAWTVNSRSVWRNLWRWHVKKNIYATPETGGHLMRVYRQDTM